MSNPAIVVDPNGVLPTRYYGEAAIAERLGVSRVTLRRMALKMAMPLIQMPCSMHVCRSGWRWYTDEELLQRWFTGLAAVGHGHRLRTKGARAETVRERCIKRNRKIPLEHATQADIDAGNVQPNRGNYRGNTPIVPSDTVTISNT